MLRETVVGTAIVASSNVVRLLAQFVAIPILARLLSPSDYGLVGIAKPFVFFAMMLADAGIGMSLVRTPSSNRVVWSTCFWLSLALGGVLACLMFLAAPLAAYVYHEPRLAAIVQVLGVVILTQSASAIPGAMLQQTQRFRPIAAAEVTAMLAGITAALAIALGGGGAWALVGQQLAFYGIRLAVTWGMSGFRPLIVFDWGSAKGHVGFGRDVLSVNVLGFITRSLDSLVIGRTVSASAVGVYSMAFQFARIPTMLVTGPLQFVLYGQLSSATETDKAALRTSFLVITQVLAIVILPPVAMAAAASKPVFTLLLSPKWEAAGPVFMIVAVTCAVQAVTSICDTMLLVLGRPDIRLRRAVETSLLWGLALLVTAKRGIEPLAIMYDVVACFSLPRTLSFVLPLIGCTASQYIKVLLVPMALSILGVAIYRWGFESRSMSEAMNVVAAAVLAATAILVAGLVQRRAILLEVSLWRASTPRQDRLG